jgi:hypothetical protein
MLPMPMKQSAAATQAEGHQMIIKIILLSAVCGLLFPPPALAQGTLYVSNLGRPSAGSIRIGSDSWGAAFFRTGTNSGGYTLNSVQLLMGPELGNPSGLVVSIYTYSFRFPGTSIGSLTGVDPIGGGIYSYSTVGIPLTASTDYFLVVTSLTPSAQGSFNWNTTTNASFDSDNGWKIGFGGTGLVYLRSLDGINWSGLGSLTETTQFGINATRIPEPSAFAISVVGLAGLALRCSKRIQRLYFSVR